MIIPSSVDTATNILFAFHTRRFTQQAVIFVVLFLSGKVHPLISDEGPQLQGGVHYEADEVHSGCRASKCLSQDGGTLAIGSQTETTENPYAVLRLPPVQTYKGARVNVLMVQGG